MTDIEDDRLSVWRNAGSLDERSTARQFFRCAASALVAAYFEQPKIGMIRGSSVDESCSIGRRRKGWRGLETGDQSRDDGVSILILPLHGKLEQ
jgi:hypothetical protein